VGGGPWLSPAIAGAFGEAEQLAATAVLGAEAAGAAAQPSASPPHFARGRGPHGLGSDRIRGKGRKEGQKQLAPTPGDEEEGD
jgi:hypothetical protein